MKNHKDSSELVLREINEIVYVSDIHTHEILFFNQAAMDLCGCQDNADWQGKKCYKVLQNLNKPCEFCTNTLLNEQDFYCWEYYNQMMKRHLAVKDKLIEWDGRLVRLEIAIDISEKEKAMRQLEQNLLTEKTLVSCIRSLNADVDATTAINSLLETIGNYYSGDRVYIYECDYEKNCLISTYEWCRLGIKPQIDARKEVPLSSVEHRMESFRTKGEFHVFGRDEKLAKDSKEYSALKARDVDNHFAAPLLDDKEIIGFIAVDNPMTNLEEMVLLQSVSSFVMNDMKKKKQADKLWKLSYKDSLTDVWNRTRYKKILKQFERETPEKLGIVYTDINGVKEANDLYGHFYGDKMIIHTARVINELFPECVYRIGGDEFVILCTNLSYRSFTQRIDQLYDRVHKDELCNLSVGVKWMEEGEDVNRQIIAADRLMYADKQRYYSTQEKEDHRHKTGVAKHLIQEIKDGKFTIYLQPKIDLRSNKLYGAEALVRRFDDQGELVAPIQFIPLYEAQGIIRYIDFFVLDCVCRQLVRWHEMGNDTLKIAVNLSRFTLMEHNITAELVKVCKQYEISPSRIVIEVTETIGQLNREELVLLMERLKTAGFTVSLDDFGQEYSNLAILVALQFDEVKLDKSVVDYIVSNQKSTIVVDHAINMCKDLGGITSIAEGIETGEQLVVLKKLQCDVGQGYLFDRPLPVEQFEKKYITNAED